MTSKALVAGYDTEKTKDVADKLKAAGYTVTVEDPDKPFNGMSFDFIIVDELVEDTRGK